MKLTFFDICVGIAVLLIASSFFIVTIVMLFKWGW